MNKILSFKSLFFVFAIPLFMLSGVLILALTPSLMAINNSKLSAAIILDLTLTIPLVYLWLIRNRTIPKLTVVPVFIIGIVTASLIIPAEQQYVLGLVKTWLFPLVEITVFATIVYKVNKFMKAYKQAKNNTPDSYLAVKEAAESFLPKGVSNAAASEASLLYYSFFAWKKHSLIENEFTYHQKSSTVSLLYGFCLVIVAEGIGTHIWLAKSHMILAWVFTFLSTYALIQVFGIIKSLPRRLIQIDHNFLHLKFGLLGDLKVHVDQIEEIKAFTKDLPEGDKSLKKLCLTDYNILLTLKEEHTVKGLYGIPKKCTKVAFFVDQHHDLIHQIQNLKLSQNV